MANLTVSIDDGVLKRARMRALEEGTSVNAVVRDHLERFGGRDPAAQALEEFLAFARSRVPGDRPSRTRRWTRAELYERS